jgi:hypothetical protein
MTREEAIVLICYELDKAEKKFPLWPTDPMHAVGVLAEETGEVVQACLDACYWNHIAIHKAKHEAAQVGAMAVRFIMNTDLYKCNKSEQK